MASHGIIDIYSNDGAETLASFSPSVGYGGTLTITGTGAEYVDNHFPYMNGTYAYSGSNTFLGLATSPNATTPTYGIGTAVDISSGGEHMSLYIVEEVKEATKPTITFDLTTLGLTGTHSITVRAKASGYADSAESEAVEYSKPITDLTDTTWLIKRGWTATAGYGVFEVESGCDIPFAAIAIGYTGSMTYEPMENKAVFVSGAGTANISSLYAGILFTIAGGTDATNTNLISWLKANAIQITEKHISFSIAPNTRIAEEGMTWGEWVESEYNTSGWFVEGDVLRWEAPTLGGYLYNDSDYTSNVLATETIIEGHEYYDDISHGGGSN